MPTNATFGLESQTVSSDSSGSTPRGDLSSFLGFGIDTPFRREASDFASVGGIDHVKSMIGEVLGVRSGNEYMEGELLWRHDFGSLLHLLRHKNNTSILQELSTVYVVQALSRWVPQVLVKEIYTEAQTGQDGNKTVLSIRLVYDIKLTNQRGNSVLVNNVSQSLSIAA